MRLLPHSHSPSYQQGYVLLILTIIITTVGIGLAVTSLSNTTRLSQSAIISDATDILSSDAQSCTEIVIDTLRSNNFYGGDQTITLPSGNSCRVFSITGSGNMPRNIIVQTSGTETTRTYETRLLQIVPYIVVDYQRFINTIADGGIDGSSLNINNPYLVNSSNLMLWLKADSLNTLSGSQVTFWQDSSSNGLNANQTTPTYQPTYHQRGLNAYPTIRFDGIDDFMIIPSTSIHSNTNGLSIFVVGLSTSTSNTQSYVAKFDDTNNERQWRLQNDDFTITELNSTLNPNEIASFTNTTNTFRLMTGIWTPTNPINTFINSSPSGTAIQGVTTITDTTEPIIIGAHQQGLSNFLQGDIAEIIIYNTALNSSQRNQIESYLNQKYDIY